MAKRGGFPGGGMPGNMANLMKQAQKISAGVVATQDHKAEIERLIVEKIGKKVEVEVRQVEEGRRFEESFVDLESLINMEITVED